MMFIICHYHLLEYHLSYVNVLAISLIVIYYQVIAINIVIAIAVHGPLLSSPFPPIPILTC